MKGQRVIAGLDFSRMGGAFAVITSEVIVARDGEAPGRIDVSQGVRGKPVSAAIFNQAGTP